MSKVLIVDDEKSMRITLSAFLEKEGFESGSAGDAQTACQMIWNTDYDVVVTDIIMPRMSGIDLLSQIREKSQTIQVIIMTGEPTVETAVQAVQNGANDYLTKPINKEIFLKTVRHAAQIKLLHDDKAILEKQNQLYQKRLEEMVEVRTTALQNAMQGSISLLASLVEIRDPYTAGHQRRVGNLAAAIAKKMNIDGQTIDLIRIIGYIHDIGKIVIPAEILSKPGNLSLLEIEMIKNHAFTGYEMLSKVSLPPIIGETIYEHHERCDGSGYPRGLKGSDISMESHIIIVADVVEAIISHRPYRPALGLEAALQEIAQHSGSLFDAHVVKACLDLFYHDYYLLDDTEHKICISL